MIERMTALLPSERQQFSRNILPRRESFEVLYHLHFDNLCADFQEDIRFKFSLGFTALLKKFMALGNQKKAKYDYYGNNVPRSLGSPGSPQTPTNEFVQPQDDWSVFTKFIFGKSHFSQNSHFQNLNFPKNRIKKISFFTKFTFRNSHYSHNSHLENLTFTKFKFTFTFLYIKILVGFCFIVWIEKAKKIYF